MSDKTKLKRSLSLPLITFYGLGTILGAGIYVLIGEVTAKAGIYAPVAFLLSAVIAGFTAFSYAELSARYPRSAGEAIYINVAFKKYWLSTVIGWSVVVIGMVSAATIANGFVGYLDLFIQIPHWLAISMLVMGLGLLAAWGINESIWVATVITLLEIGGLIMVIILGSQNIENISQRLPEIIPPLSGNAWLGITLGAFLAFYAFIGFEDMVNVAEEVKNPSINLPRAIVITLIITTILYISVTLVAVLSMPVEILSQSDAPLAAVISHSGFASPISIGLISMLAVVNGALIQIIMASRVIYGMSCQNMAPCLFSGINPYTRTPLIATMTVTFLVMMFALWLPLVTLAQITSYITLSVFAMVNLALWRIKKQSPKPEFIVIYPPWVPAGGFILCLLFILIQAFFSVYS